MKANKSLCKGKSVKNPNRCKKVTGCKVASGKVRGAYCRKRHNMTKKRKMQKKTPTSSQRKRTRNMRLNRLRKQLN